MSFREFLQEKAHEEIQVELFRRRDEWVAAVGQLIARFRVWLQEADEFGVLEITPVVIPKLEEVLGAYQVQGLRVRLGGTVVQVVPVGRNVVGFVGPRGEVGARAEGRVDISDGARKYILYRTLQDGEERWHVIDERFEVSTLDQERFGEIMQELLS